MISLRNLIMESGLMTLVIAFAVSGAAAAQLGGPAKATPTDQHLSYKHIIHPQEASLQTSPNSAGADIRMQARGGPDRVVRPASAIPPERIAVEPGTRPVLAPRDDPRAVEEIKDLPAPADK